MQAEERPQPIASGNDGNNLSEQKLPKSCAHLSPSQYADQIRNAAYPLAIALQSDAPLERSIVNAAMTSAFGGTDAEGAWNRKDAYEAQEVALIMLLHAAARTLRSKTPEQVLNFVRKKQEQLPTQTVRTDSLIKFQQFSTPLPLAFLVLRAARVMPNDIVLEPSAGTGIMATMAKLNRAQVVVNEYAEKRAAILRKIFLPGLVFNEKGEQLHNVLPPGITPSVVIANPPFSRSTTKDKNDRLAILKHLTASFSRLADGGRMVLISGENFKPNAPSWRKSYQNFRKRGDVKIVASFGVARAAYRKNGTNFATRITVFDKVPEPDFTDTSMIDNRELKSQELFELISALPPRHAALTKKLMVGLPAAVYKLPPPHPSELATPTAAKLKRVDEQADGKNQGLPDGMTPAPGLGRRRKQWINRQKRQQLLSRPPPTAPPEVAEVKADSKVQPPTAPPSSSPLPQRRRRRRRRGMPPVPSSPPSVAGGGTRADETQQSELTVLTSGKQQLQPEVKGIAVAGQNSSSSEDEEGGSQGKGSAQLPLTSSPLAPESSEAITTNKLEEQQRKEEDEETDKQEEAVPLPERDLTPHPVEYVTVEMPLNDFGGVEDELQCFESYEPKRISIKGAKPHPTDLVESSAMSAVLPPIPTYVPQLPRFILEEGVLSSCQLETVIYAGNAHLGYLSGYYKPGDNYDTLAPTSKDDPEGRRYRRGFFLGDSTGCGKGRQISGVILDDFLSTPKGTPKRAVWLSKSAQLIEDAKRDWQALGGNPDDIVSLSKWNLDQAVNKDSGILFVTYSTLRTERNGRSRFDQINAWLGENFEGVIAFDEAHEMGGAVASKNKLGIKREPSQQGLKGIRLQNANPGAKVMYVSATAATEVSNLSYATRLGLWGTGEFPFDERDDFIGEVEKGGVVAMEVVARDLKALGLYISRVLSFKGVENELVKIPLTVEQRDLYNTYARGFQTIHQNMQQAFIAAGIMNEDGEVLNKRARMSAVSTFEGMKQRFFNHLLTAMKVPVLIREIKSDLAAGKSAVVQIVSTNEALTARKIQDIPEKERENLNIDITPREALVDYLQKSFPIHAYEEYERDGHSYSEVVKDSKGNDVVSFEAQKIRDDLLINIALLPPLYGALEQLLFAFGEENVAEVTGRKQRILLNRETDAHYVSKIPANAKGTETSAFMDGRKRILVFSEAGGTGRSYHADLNAANQQPRVHYILEAGWTASKAIQGLGRTHRTNQAHPPLFRILSTDVLGELRFISSICRRVNQLGALTRGQRQAAGQSIFDDSSNLESRYAGRALNFLYDLITDGKIDGFSVAEFQQATGLRLLTDTGEQVFVRPPMTRFLNRLLALPIDQQNSLFSHFNRLHSGVIEAAREAGTYEAGVQGLKGENFRLTKRELLYTHPVAGSTTTCSEIEVTRNVQVLSSRAALRQGAMELDYQSRSKKRIAGLFINKQSGRVALVLPTTSVTGNHGETVSRVQIIRPAGEEKMHSKKFLASQWHLLRKEAWMKAWDREALDAPTTTTERMFIISGVLLPVWGIMQGGNSTVYQIPLDDGERLLGRVVQPADIDKIHKAMQIASKVELTPDEVFAAVFEDGQKISIGSGISLVRATVNHEHRIRVETANKQFTKGLLERLQVTGCFSEILYGRICVFVSTNESVAKVVISDLQVAFGGGIVEPKTPATPTTSVEKEAAIAATAATTGQSQDVADRSLYPTTITNKPELVALYLAVEQNEALTLEIDKAVREVKNSHWRGHQTRERAILSAIHKVVQNDGLTADVFDVIKAQKQAY